MTSHQPTVLIVEDDPVFRRVMSFTVANAGNQVENASNGLEGFQRFMQGGIDFVVTDLQMPHSNGIELLERIAAQTEQPRVPTILCTAKGLELDTQDLIQRFGLVAVMRKPFSPRRLSDLIIEATATGRADAGHSAQAAPPGANPVTRIASTAASFSHGTSIHG